MQRILTVALGVVIALAALTAVSAQQEPPHRFYGSGATAGDTIGVHANDDDLTLLNSATVAEDGTWYVDVDRDDAEDVVFSINGEVAEGEAMSTGGGQTSVSNLAVAEAMLDEGMEGDEDGEMMDEDGEMMDEDGVHDGRRRVHDGRGRHWLPGDGYRWSRLGWRRLGRPHRPADCARHGFGGWSRTASDSQPRVSPFARSAMPDRHSRECPRRGRGRVPAPSGVWALRHAGTLSLSLLHAGTRSAPPARQSRADPCISRGWDLQQGMGIFSRGWGREQGPVPCPCVTQGPARFPRCCLFRVPVLRHGDGSVRWVWESPCRSTGTRSLWHGDAIVVARGHDRCGAGTRSLCRGVSFFELIEDLLDRRLVNL